MNGKQALARLESLGRAQTRKAAAHHRGKLAKAAKRQAARKKPARK